MSGAQTEASPSKHIIIHCLEVGYFRFMASDVEQEYVKTPEKPVVVWPQTTITVMLYRTSLYECSTP